MDVATLAPTRLLRERSESAADAAPGIIVTTMLAEPRADTDLAIVESLRRTCHTAKLVVIADRQLRGEPALPGDVEVVRSDPGGGNPRLARWRLIRTWLEGEQQSTVDWVWCVDAGTTEMLRDPFGEMVDGVIYAGSETSRADLPWLIEHHPSSRRWAERNGQLRRFDPGLVGGDRWTMLALLDDLVGRLDDAAGDLTDIGAFNETLWSPRWSSRTVAGDRVDTTGRGPAAYHPLAWWRRHRR